MAEVTDDKGAADDSADARIGPVLATMGTQQQSQPTVAAPDVPDPEPEAEIEHVCLPMEYEPVDDSYVVLATQLGNMFEHGRIVSRAELEQAGVAVDDRVSAGALARLDSASERVIVAIAGRAEVDAAQRRLRRSIGVIENG